MMIQYKKMCGWVVAGVILISTQVACGVDENIVFIDLDRIFNDYYKTQLADDQLKDQAEGFNEERKILIDKYDRLEEEFNALRSDAQNLALSEELRNAKRDEAEEKLIELRREEREIRRFEKTHRKQLEDQQRRMRERIVEVIRESIKSYSEEEGFTAVVDSSGQSLNGVEMILYLDPKRDITDDVLEIINRAGESE